MKPFRGLYGMVDVPPSGGGVPAGRLARALLDGGARIMQLRMKGATAAALAAVCDELRPLCRARDVLFIVNDRLDVALAGGADGVHLGQDDLPLAAAKRVAPAGFAIGVSTHNEAQARAAAEGGADYIAFGPCFPTSSKVDPDPVVGLAALRAICALPLPVVAIGGITLDTVGDVVRAGAYAAAIIRAVNSAPDVAAAARAVTSAFATDSPSR
ncbi:MAG: thiamine-phosphate diphosphorylase [Myxococcales bacterium]|nr:thiamine-phosphate diphosphorylase [Myxococcales bacterium]